MKKFIFISVCFLIFLAVYSLEYGENKVNNVKDMNLTKPIAVIDSDSLTYLAKQRNVEYTYRDSLIFDKIRKRNNEQHLDSLPISDLMFQVGLSFLKEGTPYVAHELDRDIKTERLVANLHGLDCSTFVENSLAIARLIKQDRLTESNYFDELRKLRYREGLIEDYTSRLHYASDWIYCNEQRGVFENITRSIGGMRLPLKIDFMSRNYQKYSALLAHPAYVHKMAKLENEISKRSFFYIPKDNFTLETESYIHTGDILMLTTNVNGLDIAHQGIAYKRLLDGRLYMLHASSVGKRVMKTQVPFIEYVKPIKHFSGVVVLRLKEE